MEHLKGAYDLFTRSEEVIGFGPGKEEEAHAPNEKTWKADLVKCAAVYAAVPTLYCEDKE